MFLPKKSKILQNLVEQSTHITKMAHVFQGITSDWQLLPTEHTKLETMESKADEFVHAITDETEKTFILPLDKEDIRELTEKLDDIADNLEQTANRLYIYKIPKSNQPLRDFADLILQSVQQIQQAVLMINERKMSADDFALCYKKLHNLENEGDKLHRQVLADLLGDGASNFEDKNPVTILKWKEIFQTLEDTLDKCEDIAIVLEKLRVKYS